MKVTIELDTKDRKSVHEAYQMIYSLVSFGMPQQPLNTQIQEDKKEDSL